MFKYEFPIQIDLGKSVAGVGEIVDRINESMSDFGHSERVVVMSEIGVMTVTGERELLQKEGEDMRRIIQSDFDQRLPDRHLSIGSPRCTRISESAESISHAVSQVEQ